MDRKVIDKMPKRIFRETISTVKSVSSFEIEKNSGFSTKITVLPFLKKLNFLGFYSFVFFLKNESRMKLFFILFYL